MLLMSEHRESLKRMDSNWVSLAFSLQRLKVVSITNVSMISCRNYVHEHTLADWISLSSISVSGNIYYGSSVDSPIAIAFELTQWDPQFDLYSCLLSPRLHRLVQFNLFVVYNFSCEKLEDKRPIAFWN